MPINFSTMTQWLLQFENEDVTRNHTIVSSDNYVKICQKLFAGAKFSKKVEAFVIDRQENRLIPHLSTTFITPSSPLLLPFNFYNESYFYAKFQLEQYLAELHRVPVNEVSKIIETLSVIQLPDCYTLQMLDVELHNDIWPWHQLRDGNFEESLTIASHGKRGLQLTFILIQLWMRKLSRMSDSSSTLIFIGDAELLKEVRDSEAWLYTYRRLASFNMYLVTPEFDHESFGLASPPIVLSDRSMPSRSIGF